MTTQTRWQAAAILGTLAAIVAVALPASAGPDAQSAGQSPTAAPGLPVTVNNGAANPVPVKAQGPTDVTGTVNIGNLPATQQVAGTVNIGNFPASTPAPLWQGTPYISSAHPPTDHADCVGFGRDIPAGQVLYIIRATSSYSLYQGQTGHSQWLKMTLPGVPGESDLFIPTYPAGTRLSDTFYTGYLDIGIPVTQLLGCGRNATITVMGYLVPAPE